MQRLVTIGYEGAAIEAFIETLRAAEVDILLDIREAPISRRRDFGKRALEAALATADIAYRHEPRLGAPKSLRDQVKADGDYTRFFEGYAEHLAANDAVLNELAADSRYAIALMCYERDYRVCHRWLVADAIAARTNLSPQHLRPPRGS